MSNLFEEYTQQLRDAFDRKSALGRLSYWLEKHTRHGGGVFSFKGHEFQREIIDSKHNNTVIIKPSQMGLTECGARLILGFLAVEINTVAMYLLPTLGESQKAVKSRFDHSDSVIALFEIHHAFRIGFLQFQTTWGFPAIHWWYPWQSRYLYPYRFTLSG